MDTNLDRTKKGEAWAKASTAIAVLVAVTLVAAKAFGYWTTGSVALLGSLADSALDLLGSAAAFFAVRYAAKPADDDHRFGHQKAEALSALGQSFLISASALFLAVESIERLIAPEPVRQAGIALSVLALSLLATMALVAFQTVAMRRSGSLIVEGDRAHYLGDVIAQGGALIAIALSSQLGFLRADALAGLVAAGFLAWSVRELIGKALPQVMDEELPDHERQKIINLLDQEPEASGYHHLRTRRSGGRRFVQLHLDLDPEMKLRDAHAIADRVERKIASAFPDVDVIVHQDPAEDDPQSH